MNIAALLLIVLVVFAITTISGCTQQAGNTITSQQEASEAVKNISTDIEDIESILDDIDSSI